MGSLLWGVDMLLNDLVRPMLNAYQFKDYETAANLVRQLNDFLVGYGEGIDDLPPFDNVFIDIHDRVNPQIYYKDYYEEYSGLVLKSMGHTIKTVLNDIRKANRYEQQIV